MKPTTPKRMYRVRVPSSVPCQELVQWLLENVDCLSTELCATISKEYVNVNFDYHSPPIRGGKWIIDTDIVKDSEKLRIVWDVKVANKNIATMMKLRWT